MTLVVKFSGPRFAEILDRGALSPEFRSAALADFAREGIGLAREHNRRVLGGEPRLTVDVDGRAGAALDSVKPEGRIVAEFDLMDGALRWIARTLVERSPVISGAYLRAHKLFADGREISVLAGEAVPLAESYTFINDVAYARKIEIGRTATGRPFLIQVENRIYERTARDAAARFGNLARIRFTFRASAGGAIVPYKPAGSAGAALSRQGGAERAGRVPAIIVTRRG